MKTKQTDFWSGDFGREYTLRNSRTANDWDEFYLTTWGKTKIEMNQSFIGDFQKEIKILEVGCNTGMQLNGLQTMGFKNLFGIELQQFAVAEAKKFTTDINIICASGFDIPFKDNYFDIVCTNGVLIHIAPEDLPAMMKEMYRCSSKYIWGFEYFANETTTINYRNNEDYLWKANYANLFMELFPDLKLVKQEMYPYIQLPSNIDCMYLLEKI